MPAYSKAQQTGYTVDAASIQRYAKVSTPKLKERAQKVFNAWIRKRDEGRGCICCGSTNRLQAGHFYSAGHYNGLRFHEDNCWAQCMRCNCYLHGNLNIYRINLIKEIGIERVEALDQLAKVRTTKNDRFTFIDIIELYR